MFCEKCGAKIPDGVKFCPGCGQKVLNITKVKSSVVSSNPSSIDSISDKWNSFSTGKKIVSIIVLCCIGLFVIGLIGSVLSPDANTSSSYYDSDSDSYDSDSYDSDSYDSDVSESSSSDSDYSYSSSSNGHDVHTHYEGEEGTDDTYGTVYDDGSIESHSSGHTKYGDYQMDSYMDSDGNIHGSANIGGKSYSF